MSLDPLQVWQAQSTGASEELRRQFGPRASRTTRDEWNRILHPVPAQCDICGNEPFHSRDACPSLATSASIQLLIDGLVGANLEDASEDAIDTALDLIAELQFHLQAILRCENEQLAKSSAQDGRLVQRRCQAPDPGRRREWVEHQLGQRSTTFGVPVPPELAKLRLPPRREDAPIDFNRVLVKMSPRWPWYPPPPFEPMELNLSQDRLRKNCPLPGDEQLVEKFEAECAKWLSGVDFFLRWYNSDMQQLVKLQTAQRLRPSVLSQTQLEEEFRASLIPRSHVQYADVMRDPTAPPFVCQWRERSFTELRGTGSHAQIVWYVLTNARSRPRHIPSASLPRRRVDGHYGEHTPMWYPQWLLDGQWYIAFHDRYINADGSTRGHCDPSGRFLWYHLQEDHCVRSPMHVRGAEHLDAFFLGHELLRSIVRDHLEMRDRVFFWREAHFWAADFPHDQLQTAEYIFRSIGDVPQSMRNLRDTVAGYQQALGMLNAWCNYRAEFRTAMQARDQAFKMGRPFMPATKAKNLGRYTGAYVDSESRACLLNGLNCDVFLVTPKPRAWEGIRPMTNLVDIQVECRAWEDGSIAPIYVSNLRPYDPHEGEHLAPLSNTDCSNGEFGDDSATDFASVDFNVEVASDLYTSNSPARYVSDPQSSSLEKPTGFRATSDADYKTLSLVPDGSAAAEGLTASGSRKRPRADNPDFDHARLGRKHARLENGASRHVEAWFPTPFGPSRLALDDIQITALRQKEVSHREHRPVPLKYRRRQHITRTPEINVLAGKKNPKITAKMFLVYLIITRYIDEDLQARPFSLDAVQGLAPAEWQSLFKGMSSDYSSHNGANPDETLRIMQQLGMAQLLAVEPQTVELEPEPFVPILLDTDQAEEGQPGDLFQSLNRVGQGDGYYFTNVLADDIRPLALESDRYLYEPSGWRRDKNLDIRSVHDFSWFIEFEAVDKCDEDVIEFMLIAVKPADADSYINNFDIWVCYDRAWVFVLQRMAEIDGLQAAGEHMFARPIRRMTLGGSRDTAIAMDSHDDCDLRVWHHFNIKDPLPVPIDALGQVGSLAVLGGDWKRTRTEMETITPRALAIAVPASIPQPLPTQLQNKPASVRQWIESHVAHRPDRLVLDQHDVLWSAEDNNWPAVPLRTFIAWRMSEANWREQFKAADDLVILTHHVLTSDSRATRYEKLSRVWGGTGLVPTGPNPLASSDWMERLPCVTAFAVIVSSWPGFPANIPTTPPKDARQNRTTFEHWEARIWAAYTLIFSDYMFRKPPQLYIRPAAPW